MSKLKFSSIRVIILALGLIFLLLHGMENVTGFKIDTVSAILLLFAFSPYLPSFVQKVKIGDYEALFSKQTTAEALVGILEQLSEVRMLTYYKPREAESALSDAHRLMVEHLMKEYKDDLHEELKLWLSTGSDYVRWMASEIIGFYSVKDLKSHLYPLYQDIRIDQQWPEWKLNCLWAHSKIDNDYQEMHNFLMGTKNAANQIWLLGAYDQMVLKRHCVSSKFLQVVVEFSKRDDLLPHVKGLTTIVMDSIKKSIDTDSPSAPR